MFGYAERIPVACQVKPSMVPDPSDVPLLITVSRCSSAGVMFDDAGAASTPKKGLVKTSRRDVNHILELAAAA